MKQVGYNLRTLDVKNIDVYRANDFLLFLRAISDSEHLHSSHLVVMKTFFNWISEIKQYKISNPFKFAEIRFDTSGKSEIIEESEFELLLKMVTPDRGFSEFKNSKGRQKGKNLYRTYLKNAFRLALETGCRREELVVLKWSQIKIISAEVQYIDTVNIKVTKLKQNKKKNNSTTRRIIPMTGSLKKLLIELGYKEKIGSDEYIIERPTPLSDDYMYSIISRAFNHYIKFVDTGDRKIEFKNLRKTYCTFLTLKLGPNAATFTGHADAKVLKDHYLAKEYISGDLGDFNMFGVKKLKTKNSEEIKAIDSGVIPHTNTAHRKDKQHSKNS